MINDVLLSPGLSLPQTVILAQRVCVPVTPQGVIFYTVTGSRAPATSDIGTDRPIPYPNSTKQQPGGNLSQILRICVI